MKVLTWNILASEWIDKTLIRRVEKEVACNTNNRIEQIIKYIIEKNPDIILLQEVMPSEYKKISKKLNDRYSVNKLRGIDWYGTTGESGNVTLLRRDIISENGVTHEILEFGLHTKCRYKNKEVHVLNVHLDDQSIKKRYKQREEILSRLGDAKAIIIGGDFNHEYKKNTSFYNLPEYTLHNTECATYYISRKMNVDNILTKGFELTRNLQCPKYPEDEVSGLLKYGSDHLPIMIDIGIPK